MAGDCCGGGCDSDRSRDERWERVLLIALAINGGMFAYLLWMEITSGIAWLGRSGEATNCRYSIVRAVAEQLEGLIVFPSP